MDHLVAAEAVVAFKQVTSVTFDLWQPVRRSQWQTGHPSDSHRLLRVAPSVLARGPAGQHIGIKAVLRTQLQL